MTLTTAASLAAAYHSGAQRARVVMEAWGEQNLFCPNCSPPNLSRRRGTRTVPLWLIALN